MHSHRLRAHPSQRLHFEHMRQVDRGGPRVGARLQQRLDNIQLAVPNEGGNQRAIRGHSEGTRKAIQILDEIEET
jgi:hypothetical protein